MATILNPRSPGVASYLNPITMVRNLWRHRNLIRQFVRREIEGRYRGSFLGMIWSFVNPLVQLLIYTFVFGAVLQARWPNARTENLGEFAITLFCGLVVFNLFSECVSRAPALVVNVPSYVKKVVFPLEILPLSVLGAALFHFSIGLLVLLGGHLAVGGALHWTLLLVPVVLVPLLLLNVGIAWLLSSLGVFVRDIGYVIGLVLQILMFLTPIFYPVELVPAPYRAVIGLGPLTPVVDGMRRVVLWGQSPDWVAFTLSLALNAIICLLGYAFFMKTKKAFADVL